ncbi:hypothetical protein AYR65_00105 [Klebsiella pneumoniae]|nr:hypothetical protein AYR65_00105 [Klebsiella pneumoniae]
MMSLWDALRMNMMISYQELVRTFLSMPDWAKAIGSCLPLTYFIRLVKGIMLKGYSATALLPDLLPLIGLAVIVIGVGLKSYRKTLD